MRRGGIAVRYGIWRPTPKLLFGSSWVIFDANIAIQTPKDKWRPRAAQMRSVVRSDCGHYYIGQWFFGAPVIGGQSRVGIFSHTHTRMRVLYATCARHEQVADNDAWIQMVDLMRG